VSDQVPVVKVELKRANAAELIAAKPELSGAPFIKALGAASKALVAGGVMRRFQDKAVLMQQGDSGRSLLFVLAGDVRLFARRDTDSVELGVAHSGDVIGECEVLSNEARRCSAVALGQVDVLELQRDALLVGGKVPPNLSTFLEGVKKHRMKALDEMSDFLNRW
jgi:CRP-like cAMP-binding protein